MRRSFLLLLLLLLISGCWLPWLSQRPTAPSASKIFQSLGGPAGSDVVVMEVAVLETTIGDSYVNEGLWNTAIEQSLSEVRPSLVRVDYPADGDTAVIKRMGRGRASWRSV